MDKQKLHSYLELAKNIAKATVAVIVWIIVLYAICKLLFISY